MTRGLEAVATDPASDGRSEDGVATHRRDLLDILLLVLPARLRCRMCLRLALSVLGAVLLIETVILIPSAYNYERDLTEGLLRESLATVRSVARAGGHSIGLRQPAGHVIDGSRVEGLALYDIEGRLLSLSGTAEGLAFGALAPGETAPGPASGRMLAAWGPERIGMPVVAVARIDRSWIPDEIAAFVVRILGLSLLISGFVAAVTMAIFSRTVLLPILALRDRMTAASREPEAPERHVEAVSRRDEVGEMIGAFNRMLSDLGRARRREVQRLAAMTENSLAATVAYDSAGELVYCNRAALSMFVAEDCGALHAAGTPRVATEEGEVALADHVRFGPSSGEQVVVGPDGQSLACLMNTGEVRGDDGAVELYFASLYDITQIHAYRRQLEAQNFELQAADRAKTEFLANMSHELRTPLNAVIGFSQVLEREMFGPLGDPAYREYVADIRHSGEHLLDLISDILDLSKIEAGRTELAEERLDLDEVFESCVRLLAERAQSGGVAVAVEAEPGLPRLYADARMVKQIVLNLAVNAIKFTPAGGSVCIEATMAEDGLRLSVVDTGIGMSSDDLARALTPFGQVGDPLTRRQDGAGLGLPLVQKLAELHGARFDIESVPGTGTTVSVTFPAARVLSAASYQPRRPAAHSPPRT